MIGNEGEGDFSLLMEEGRKPLTFAYSYCRPFVARISQAGLKEKKETSRKQIKEAKNRGKKVRNRETCYPSTNLINSLPTRSPVIILIPHIVVRKPSFTQCLTSILVTSHTMHRSVVLVAESCDIRQRRPTRVKLCVHSRYIVIFWMM